MKPKLKKVTMYYWDCGNPDHRHTLEKTALMCMEKVAKRRPVLSKEDRHKRYIMVMRAVILGSTWKEAGAMIDVSGNRCRQIVHMVMRTSLHPKRISGSMPDHDYRNVREMRSHHDFWMAQSDVMAKEWAVDPCSP